MYRGRGDVLTPPQSSPESHHSHINNNSNNLGNSKDLKFDGERITLPKNIPDIFLCKFCNFLNF